MNFDEDEVEKVLKEFFERAEIMWALVDYGLAIPVFDLIESGDAPPSGWVRDVAMEFFIHPSVVIEGGSA